MGARDTIAKLLMGKVGGPWEGGIRAYHSSPHDFDKFDWSKLRTGEGANTYGAGFYAAENPAVSGQGGQYWDQFARNRFAYSPTPEGMATRALMETKANRAAAIEKLSNPKYQEHLQHFLPNSYFKDVDPKEALKLLESGAPVGPRTYEVNIAARPELMLDWDKPLKQQSPAVYETLRTLDVPDKPHVTGSMAYWDLGGQALTRGKPSQDVPEYASKTLADAGIPGIRYLDQGSRPPSQFELEKARSLLAGAELHGDPAWIAKQQANVARLEELMTKPGTYNYVVTDPSKLDIMAKYGVVGGVPLGALAAQDQYQR